MKSSESAYQTILARRSIRKYTGEAVAEETAQKLLEAAMAAPSASNRKPWHFIVVTDRETLDRLATAHPYGKMLAGAPLSIAVCGMPEESRYWEQDCSAATENLLITVVALGLGAVWLGVHPRQKRIGAVRQILGIPEEIVPLNLISIGHPAEEKPARTQYDADRVHREHW